MQLAPRPDSFHFVRAAPVLLVYRFRLPPLLARCLTGFPAADFSAEPLVMVVAGIGGEPFFAAKAPASALFVFHLKHRQLPKFFCATALSVRANLDSIVGRRSSRQCIARLIRLRSTLHPPPGSGDLPLGFCAGELSSR
jgi:hypothetical protein